MVAIEREHATAQFPSSGLTATFSPAGRRENVTV